MGRNNHKGGRNPVTGKLTLFNDTEAPNFQTLTPVQKETTPPANQGEALSGYGTNPRGRGGLGRGGNSGSFANSVDATKDRLEEEAAKWSQPEGNPTSGKETNQG